MKPKSWILIGALAAALAVGMGAFAAHGLKGKLHDIQRESTGTASSTPSTITSAELLAIFETGARYQMYHALGLVLVGLIASRSSGRGVQIAGGAFLVGIVLFSGSLYALVLLGNPKLGMITPFGGLAFIVGWLALAAAAVRVKEDL